MNGPFPPRGKVFLVGAGPGDPGLLSLKGFQCLQTAEVIVYDALISWELERLFPQGARRVFVGKRSSRHTLPQEEINRLLVRLANEEGLRVVRLKGGDPFVFGRGGEEALALKEAGVTFEVIPGVSSAFAVPAYSGIPVTHRKVASTVAIVTGHEDPSKPAGHLDFHALASFDTIVFLMALHSLEHNVCRLIEAGKDASAPAALIQAGTTPRQRTLLAPLEEIPRIAEREAIGAPTVLVVGEVARLHEQLNWYETLPLFGKRLLVTRPKECSDTLLAGLEALGAEAVSLPMIETRPLLGGNDARALASELRMFDLVAFSSQAGVEVFFQALYAIGKDARVLGSALVAAVGEKTADALKSYGVLPDLVPKEANAEALLREILEAFPGLKRVLLPKAKKGRILLEEGLKSKGVSVVTLDAYETIAVKPPNEVLEGLDLEGFDWVLFAAPSAVARFLEIFGEAALCLPAGPKVACIGKTTARALETRGLRVDALAKESSTTGLIEAMLAFEQKGGACFQKGE